MKSPGREPWGEVVAQFVGGFLSDVGNKPRGVKRKFEDSTTIVKPAGLEAWAAINYRRLTVF
jgi:hypothetical protein